MAKVGDFVTGHTDDGIRQGILLQNNYILGESGKVYITNGKMSVVPDKNLFPLTESFVKHIRTALGIE